MKNTLQLIFKDHRPLIYLSIINTVLAGFFIAFCLIKTNFSVPVIGGLWNSPNGFYEIQWYYALLWPLLGLFIAIVHPFVALRLFKDKGAEAASIFLGISIATIVLAIAFFAKLTGSYL